MVFTRNSLLTQTQIASKLKDRKRDLQTVIKRTGVAILIVEKL
jgi:hypothetical protein